MRRILIITLILVTVIGLSVDSYQVVAGEKSEETTDVETVVVERGIIEATISASGVVEPAAEVSLSFGTGGRLQEGLVEEGQAVAAGDVLARLDTTDLELQLAQAKVTLTINEAQLAKLLAPPKAQDVAAAKASLISAQAAYDKVVAGPTEDEIIVAKANLQKAEAALKQAQAAYDQVRYVPGVGALPQSAQLEQATIDYQAAKANYDITMSGSKDEEIKAAAATLAQAKANLANLLAGPTEEDVAVAEAQVEQARRSVEQIQLQIEEAPLRAPFSAVVYSVTATACALVGGGPPLIGLVDTSGFHVEVKVDEVDVGQVAAGQPVVISLDAFPDVEITGRVEMIAPAASVDSGVNSYRVMVAIDPVAAELRAGMSATAHVTTAHEEGVLLVPNRLIRIERQTGQAYVERLEDDGAIARVEIETGMRNEEYTEATSGLGEGDKLVVRRLTTRQRLQESGRRSGRCVCWANRLSRYMT